MPMTTKRGIEGPTMHDQHGEVTPQWYCFETNNDAKAVAFFEDGGVQAWFPTEQLWVPFRGARRKILATRKLIPGYVLACFVGQPQWDLICGCRYIRRPITSNGLPAVISEADLLKMAQVPQVLAEKRAKMLEAKRIQPGDTVYFTQGQLKGEGVEVKELDGDILRFFIGAFPGTTDVSMVEKIVDEIGVGI